MDFHFKIRTLWYFHVQRDSVQNMSIICYQKRVKPSLNKPECQHIGLIVNIKATCILDSKVWEWGSWTDHRINTANLNIQSSYILISILLAIWKRTDAPGKASFNGCGLLRDVITIQTESCFQSQNVSGPESSQLYPLQCQQPLSQLYYLISRHWDLHT